MKNCIGCVLDTNVFYDLKNEKIDSKLLRKKCSKLFLTEINLLEVISKADNGEYFDEMKDVARKFFIVDDIAPSTMFFLCKEWGIQTKDGIYDWEIIKEVIRDFCDAKSKNEIQDIIDQATEQKEKYYGEFRTAIIQGSQEWLNLAEEAFAKAGITDQEEKRKKYRELITNEDNKKGFLESSRKSAYSFAKIQEIPPLSDEELLKVGSNLNLYTEIYALYCTKRLFKKSETKLFNDFGDLDFMRYIAVGFCVVTREDLWLGIASELKLEDSIFCV